MRRLLGVRDARVFLAGQAVSSFGDSALWLGTGIWVKALTGSNGAAGLVFFFFSFSAPALLAPVTGLVVDRMDRRRLLIAVNAFTGCAVAALLPVHGAGQLWLVSAVMAVYGLAFSALTATQSALLTELVAAELLPDANGALRTLQGTLGLLAPLTGAGLFTPQTISIAAGAALIGIVGYRMLLGAMAAGNRLAGAYLLGRYGWRVEQSHQPCQRQRPGPAGVG